MKLVYNGPKVKIHAGGHSMTKGRVKSVSSQASIDALIAAGCEEAKASKPAPKKVEPKPAAPKLVDPVKSALSFKPSSKKGKA